MSNPGILTNQACSPARNWSVGELVGILGEAGLLDAGLFAELGPPKGSSQLKRRLELVCIDSRAVLANSLFVALKGERNDGHDFIQAIAGLGSVTTLVSSDWAKRNRELVARWARDCDLICLPLGDPLAGLQAFARAHLKSLPHLIRIGITGSSGKTTTKDLVVAALGKAKRVFGSKGNLNSIIGLPLAILAVPADCEVAVFEMAMSEKGEMACLADLVLPDYALITNIGLAHIGNIGSQEGIAYEKKQIFSRFDGRQVALLPKSDQWYDFLAKDLAGQVLPYGEADLAGYEGWEAWKFGQIIKWRGLCIQLQLPGAHNRLDAIAAIALATRLGLDPKLIKQGLEEFKPSFGRSEIIEGGVTLVQDCYNANPDSMRLSIEAFVQMPLESGSRVMILGDMLELGPDSAGRHAAIGRLAAASGADVILFCGAEMKAAYQAATDLEASGDLALDRLVHLAWFETRDQLAQVIADYVDAGDLVLLKASRGMAMEKLSPQLLALQPLEADQTIEADIPVEPEIMAKYLVGDDDDAPTGPQRS